MLVAADLPQLTKSMECGSDASYSSTAPEATPQHIYIFLNSLSGGNAAKEYIESDVRTVLFKRPHVALTIADISEGVCGCKPSFVALKRVVDAATDSKAIVIAAGGDGTVMWAASELWAHGIDETKVLIGVMPFGTGNDFAKALKWTTGKRPSPFNRQMSVLKGMCSEWLSSAVVLHDVWEVEVTTLPHGALTKIDAHTRKKKTITEADTGRPVNNKIFKMNNYFSMGVESRIGIGFDRHRHTSKFANKMVYVNEGMKKIMFKKTIPIHDLLQHVALTEDEADESNLVFSTKSGVSPLLKKPCVSIVALNIPSFASGLDLWEACKGRPLGVEDSATTLNLSEIPQRMGDGKLEFLSFSSASSLGLENAFGGHGLRVFQGEGPFLFKFRAMDDDVRTYFQVDGEFFQMTSPKTIVIRHFKSLSVLANTTPSAANDRAAFILANAAPARRPSLP